MAQFQQWFNQDFTHKIEIRHCESVMFTGDDQGALVGVRLFNNGAAYSGGGTVTGAVKRSDGGVVALTGTLSGNAASVVIPAAALAYAGPIGVRIVLAQGGQTATVLKAIYTVDDDTGAAVDPGTIIPSVSDLITAIETAVDSIPADYSSLLAGIAPTFSASEAYGAGQFVWHNGTLYKFKADHAAGSWSSSEVDTIVLSDQAFKYIKNLRSADGDLIDNTITPGIYRWTASARPSDCPRAAAGRMIVIGPRDSYISTTSQLILFDDGQTLYRSGLYGETWPTSWSAAFGYVQNLNSSNDIDAVKWPGVYRWNAGSLPANCPTTNVGRMMVFGPANATNIYDKAQLIITGGGLMISRAGQNNDTWGDWVWYYKPDDTLSKEGYPADAKAAGDAIAAVQAGVNGAVTKTSVTSYMDSGTAIGEVDGKTFRVPVTATGDVDLSNYFTKTENPRQPLKLRVIQNNIGRFRFGRRVGEYEHTTAAAAEKLANYRRFFGDILPDFVCLQEWERYMGPDSTVDTKTDLFDPLFRTFYYPSGGPTSKRAIGTNFDCAVATVELASGATYQRAILEAYGIHVITFTLSPTTPQSGSQAEARAATLTEILTSEDSCDNVILCADLNADSGAELASLINIAKAHNFHSFVNGDYWGYSNTYMNPSGNTGSDYFRQIDGIWCKGNMKMSNGKVLFEESTDFPDNYVWNPSEATQSKPLITSDDPYNHLASDHIPVIADIVVYG